MNSKKWSLFTMALFALFLLSFSAPMFAEDTKKVETAVCPVTGETVEKTEKALKYNYNGADYFFCCDNCLTKFKADPEKYVNKTSDVVCGMAVDKKTAFKATYQGKDYYFCSEKCKADFEKDPEAKLKAAKAGGEKKQGNCPGKCQKTECPKDKK
ncbi:YHS domain-containing protein [candidate division KSB1 bacterium]|nr:YHS domain-containing protein [candidate division KSB1 bacterium]